MKMSLYKDDGGYIFVVHGPTYYETPFDDFDDIAIRLKLLPIWRFDLIDVKAYNTLKTEYSKLIAIIGE